MDPKYRLAEMTWPEVREAAAAGRVVLQPVAAIEQHGLHLPVDTDNLIVTRMCEVAAERHPGEFVVSPCVPFGFNDHNMEFPGTISISPETLLAFYVDLGKSLITNGFRRILFVNGHGSNDPIVQLASRRINNETPGWTAVTGQYYLASWVNQRERLRTSPPRGVGHACEFETSFYLHLRGDLVQLDKVVDENTQGHPVFDNHDWEASPPMRFMNWWSQRSRSGVEGAPSHATAEKGQRLFEGCVALLVEIARALRDMDLPQRVDHRPEGAWPGGLKYPIGS
jgi:creatinine amidohydrolase